MSDTLTPGREGGVAPFRRLQVQGLWFVLSRHSERGSSPFRGVMFKFLRQQMNPEPARITRRLGYLLAVSRSGYWKVRLHLTSFDQSGGFTKQDIHSPEVVSSPGATMTRLGQRGLF